MSKDVLLSNCLIILRVLAGLLTARLLIINFGPETLLTFSEYNNYSSVLIALSGGMFGSGIVRYVAKGSCFGSRNIKKIHSSIVTPYIFVLTGFLIFCSFFSPSFVPKKILIFVVILAPIRVLFRHWFSIIQGKQDFRKLLVSEVLVFLGALVSVLVGVIFGEHYFYYAFMLSVIPAVLLLSKGHWGSFPSSISRKHFFNHGFFKFGFYSFGSALSASAIALFMRDEISVGGSNYLPVEWQAVFSVSNYYVFFISAPIAAVMLPFFSKGQQVDKVKDWKICLILLFVCSTSAGIIFFSKDLIENILFSSLIKLPPTLLVIYLGAGTFKIFHVIRVQKFLAIGNVWPPLLGELAIVGGVVFFTLSGLLEIHMSYVVTNAFVSLGLYLKNVKTSSANP